MSLTVNSLPPDPRGEIHQLDLNGVKVNLLYSKKGSLRGGDVHPNVQFGVVLSGRVEIETPFCTRFYFPGDYVRIDHGVPHLYIYHENTVQAEWWSGAFEAVMYPRFRDRVEASLKGRADNGSV